MCAREEDFNEIKKLIQEFPIPDREILSKFLKAKGLTPREVRRCIYLSMPWLSLVLLNRRFQLNKKQAEEEWVRTRPEMMGDIGSVKHLKVLPVIDLYGVNQLCTESGVSYYIKADDVYILFDTGNNAKQVHPSPLLQNMEALGLGVEDINYVFISHLHSDHVGGYNRTQEGTFALSGEQLNLDHVEAYTPVPMSHPTARVTHVKRPRVIVDGVASIGPILSPQFFRGSIIEHSLTVNVEGKGLVIIVGCGHQGLQKIIDRVEILFDTPLFGIIGGLHYPIPTSRSEFFGLPTQRLAGTGKPLWDPPNRDDLNEAKEYLKARNPKLVALSPHDSSDESIEAFSETFREAYTHIRVGESITIA